MNWIKENKFLFGFIVVMAIGIGVLGFLMMGAKSSLDDALAGYQEKASELNRVQHLPIFPSQKNLDKLYEQKKQAVAEVGKLSQNLASQQVPVEEMTPEQFQDKLKAAVNTLKAKAAQSSPVIALPEKFFLGFAQYEAAPPDREAATPLGREMKAIEWVMTKLLDAHVVLVKTLDREELPEEKGKARTEEKKPGGGKGEKASKHVVRKHPFTVAFLCDQGALKKILNEVMEYKGQFFIPRLITVKNEKDKGPARTAVAFDPQPAPPTGNLVGTTTPVAPVVPVTTPPGTPVVVAGAPVVPTSTYIVGEEKIEATIVLEMVEFAEVATK